MHKQCASSADIYNNDNMKKSGINESPAAATRTAGILFLILFFTLPFCKAIAQAPGVAGVDHVGINVPDLKEGIKFFRDMFGFIPVTQIGPLKMDAAWKKHFHIHKEFTEVTIVNLRAGNGSDIELFGYKPVKAGKINIYRDELCATHISLYTSNMKASVTYLKSKGVKFLTEPMSGSGDTAGETWVYFETPWGATLELNSYPNGKGYEKLNPRIKLWSPKDQHPSGK